MQSTISALRVLLRPAATFRRLALILSCSLLLFAACGEEGEPTPTLPPETSSPTPEPTPFDPGDDDEPGDLEPAHTVDQSESGQWTISPSGGIYSNSAITGSLHVTEAIDGSDTFSCELTYALTGVIEETDCPACDFAFRVRHSLLDGDPEACYRDDLPEDDAEMLLGFSAADRALYYDYQGTGTWLKWYTAFKELDNVFFNWERTLGIELEDEDD